MVTSAARFGPYRLASRPRRCYCKRLLYLKESIRYKCNQHKVKGTLVNYKAAEKYTGDDEFDLLILFPDGVAWEIHYNISVR